jgi:hypothetical protein
MDAIGMLPTKLRFIWLNSFRGEDFLEIDRTKTRITNGVHIFNGSGRNEQSL